MVMVMCVMMILYGGRVFVLKIGVEDIMPPRIVPNTSLTIGPH